MKVRIAMFCIAAACLAACSPWTRRARPIHREVRLDAHVDYDLNATVLFKPGRPRAGEGLLSALATDQADNAERLTAFLGLNLDFVHFRLRVEGYAARSECAGSECDRLSERRARLVHALLIKKGFPAERLLPPRWHGTTQPISAEITQEDRARTQRADIFLVEPDG